MAKVKPPYLAFNGGEIGARALARTDLENYNRCAETMLNCWPAPEGELTKVPGTIYVGKTEAGGGVVRAFEYSVSDNLVLVFTASKMKIIGTDDAFLQITGADATVGTWTDQSAAPPAGGGTPPDIVLPPGFDLGNFDGVYA